MAQYQTFPDAAGGSRTLDKLKALRLPGLKGKRFLDVGCNEGFFCGYAHFDGASRSVGVDNTAAYLDRARSRHPGCEFLLQDWQQLPEGPFDVILLASALHYADDQPALIRQLVDRLAPDGLLVLELGIVSKPTAQWVQVKRGIDERSFPSMMMLEQVLADYAWKWMGPSVEQAGDPVKRHVVHVQRRRPVAYLLMEPPGYGKSTIARGLFEKAGVRIVSGDQVLQKIAQGKLAADDRLAALVAAHFTPVTIDETIGRVFEAGLLPQLARVWLDQGGGGDFALDGYVPAAYHARVEAELRDAGQLPVRMGWDRVGQSLLPAKASNERAAAYYASLAPGAGQQERPALDFRGTIGFVDEMLVEDGLLTLRGWAMHDSGEMPGLLSVEIAGRSHLVRDFDHQQRPDVQSHLGLGHDLCGFRLRLPLPGLRGGQPTGAIKVAGGNKSNALSAPFHLSEAVSAQMGKP